MEKKYKVILLVLSLLLLFMATSQTVFAALEVTDYPTIPGFAKPTEGDLPTYVSYFFGFMCYIAGATAMVSFAVGAVQLIMAASNPSLVGEGKDRMKGAVLGLILTISAVVILKTINPALVEVSLDSLPKLDGVYFTNGPKFSEASQSGDVSSITKGYETLYYKCDSGAPLLVWLFKNKGGDYSGGAETKRITCGGDVSLKKYGSFKWEYEGPGVYFCLGGCNGNMCSGYMSEPNVVTQNEIDLPFSGQLKGIRIVNDTQNSEYYGAIIHTNPGVTNGGECAEPITTTKDISCTGVSVSAFAADIFRWNRDDPDSSGDGLSFYNETYGWNSDVESGKIEATKENIKKVNGYFKNDALKVNYDYTNVDSIDAAYCNLGYPRCNGEYDEDSEEYSEIENGNCCYCATPQDCLGSIKIKGNYIVGLYSYIKDDKGKETDKLYCQTFTSDVENTDAYKYIEAGGNLKYIYIIATK